MAERVKTARVKTERVETERVKPERVKTTRVKTTRVRGMVVADKTRRAASGDNRRSASRTKTQAKHDANKRRSDAITEKLIKQLREKGCPAPEREYRFREDRAWRLDLAWPRFGVAAEIEGGVHVMGRHTRGTGFENDAIKYAAAACEGFAVIRVTPRMIAAGSAATFIAEVLRVSGVSRIPRQTMPWKEAKEG